MGIEKIIETNKIVDRNIYEWEGIQCIVSSVFSEEDSLMDILLLVHGRKPKKNVD